jgi:ribonuclease HII
MVTLLLLVLGFLLGVALTGVVAWGCFKRLVAPVLERYEKLKREFYTLEDRIKEFEANVARIRKEKVAYEDKYFFADKELKHKMIKTETLEKEILVLKSDVGELTSELATANAMLAKLRSDLERANIGNTMLSNLAKEARLKGEEVVKDVVSLQDKNQSLRLELQELKDVLTAKTEQYAKDLSTVTNQRDLVILENEKLVFEVRELKCLVERHKGYGTLEHRQAIRQFGLQTIHRRSFCFT